MRALKKNPGEGCKVIEIENDLHALQEAVGGYIEAVPISWSCCILFDEEGRLKGLPYNMTCGGHDLFGPVLTVGVDGEDFTDVPQAFEQELRDCGLLSDQEGVSAMKHMEIVKQLREYPLVQIAQEAADAIEYLMARLDARCNSCCVVENLQRDNDRLSEAYEAASRDLIRRTVQLEELRTERGAKHEK